MAPRTTVNVESLASFGVEGGDGSKEEDVDVDVKRCWVFERDR